MPKNRKMTYSDRQSEAARAKKQTRTRNTETEVKKVSTQAGDKPAKKQSPGM